MSCGTWWNSWIVNVTSSCSIQLPDTTRTIATPASFGTNVSVTSCTCVADWISEMNRPSPIVTMRIGASSFTLMVIAWSAMCRTALSVIGNLRGYGASSVEARDERLHDQRPSVHHHEQQQLERQRHQDGREHEHAHRHQ